jgi:broad specificity phosphatase PhoE
MDVFLIRHGHADHNAWFEEIGEDAYYSPKYAYSQLTPRGHQQTSGIVMKNVDIVYVSPLIRCIQSARNIFGSDVVLHLHDGLLETQGIHPCNFRESKSLLSRYANVNVDNVADDYEFVKESEDDVAVRGETAMKDILGSAVKNNYNRIAIVSHHDLLHALLGVSLRNAEVYRKYYSPEELSERIG